MPEGLEWQKCRYCDSSFFCLPSSMVTHEKDCPKKPGQMPKLRVCGACGSLMERVTAVTHTSYICINVNCSRTISLFKGGKL